MGEERVKHCNHGVRCKVLVLNKLSSTEPYLESKVQTKETKIFQSCSHGESRELLLLGSPGLRWYANGVSLAI